MANAEHTVEKAKSLVERFQEQRAQIKRNDVERQVAQGIQDGGAAPTGPRTGLGRQPPGLNNFKPNQWQQHGNVPAAPPRQNGPPGLQVCDCGGRHRPEDCYYRHPDRALNRDPYWRANPRASPAAIENLRSISH